MNSIDGNQQSGDKIERYLNSVFNVYRLRDAEEAMETREEIRQHLLALMAEYQREGLSESDAVTAALKKFGPANRVGAQLGAKSIKEFLRGLNNAVPIRVKLLRSLREVISWGCFVPVCVEFIVGDHQAWWPYYLLLIGGFVGGVLEGVDSPQVSDVWAFKLLDEAEARIEKRIPRPATLRESIRRFIARQAIQGMRSQVVVPLGKSFNPLRKLSWRFYYSILFGCVTAFLTPNLRSFLKDLCYWYLLWWTMQNLSAVIARTLWKKFVVRA